MNLKVLRTCRLDGKYVSASCFDLRDWAFYRSLNRQTLPGGIAPTSLILIGGIVTAARGGVDPTNQVLFVVVAIVGQQNHS